MLDKAKLLPPQNEYHEFNRAQWAQLRQSVPMTLNESELETIRGINESLSIAQVEDIYLPLSRLMNLYVKSRQERHEVIADFLSRGRRTPFIIGVSGSVAGGKSTTSRILQALLERWSEHPKVEIITTDGFLYPNAELKARQLMRRKGFPESYNTKHLIDVLEQIKKGEGSVEVPLYSHQSYDILGEVQVIDAPDIVILEGLNVLQTANESLNTKRRFVSDYLDFSIFVDADIKLLEDWYIQRFMKLRASAFTDPDNYFHHYAQISQDEALSIAKDIWQSINQPNLIENILPTRFSADLILEKGLDHEVKGVRLLK